jgi:hypothetical protein
MTRWALHLAIDELRRNLSHQLRCYFAFISDSSTDIAKKRYSTKAKCSMNNGLHRFRHLGFNASLYFNISIFSIEFGWYSRLIVNFWLLAAIDWTISVTNYAAWISAWPHFDSHMISSHTYFATALALDYHSLSLHSFRAATPFTSKIAR